MFYHQVQMPHFFRVTSQDESDWGVGLRHACLSTLLSQHQSVCKRLTLKIQEATFTKSGGDSSLQRSGSAVTKIFNRSTDVNFGCFKPFE